MLMKKRIIVPIGEATTVILPYAKSLYEIHFNVDELINRIIYFWLQNGASLSVDQAVELVIDHCLESLSTYDDLEMDEDRVMEILVLVEDAVERLMATLKPFFDIVDHCKGEYLPSKTKILEYNVENVHLEIEIRSPKQPSWRRNVPTKIS